MAGVVKSITTVNGIVTAMSGGSVTNADLDAALQAAVAATSGLGTAAYKNTGTSGNNVPLLDGANTWSGSSQTFRSTTAIGSGVGAIFDFSRTTTGTPVAGFGLAHHWYLSSTVSEQAVMQDRVEWVVPTHASRTARRTIYMYDSSAAREAVRMESTGSAAAIGFLGANASARLASPDLGTLATTFGFASGTPTFSSANVTELNLAAGGRLTLTTETPVTTSDVTGATNVYYTPYVHNHISLWDGSSWRRATFAEQTLAIGTVTSGLPYDVFGYLSGSSLALEKLAWTNGTTRATAITLQDGRYCKSGDKTRLYLGTFYTTSTTTTEDSLTKRFVWNMYNRVAIRLAAVDATNSWAYSSTTWRQANNNTANKVEFIRGLAEDDMTATVVASASSSVTNRNIYAAVALDSTTIPGGLRGSCCVQTAGGFANSSWYGAPSAGYHYLAWIERSHGADTQTWYGDGGGTDIQSGISAQGLF